VHNRFKSVFSGASPPELGGPEFPSGFAYYRVLVSIMARAGNDFNASFPPQKTMIVGLPKEINAQEYRVAYCRVEVRLAIHCFLSVPIREIRGSMFPALFPSQGSPSAPS
jgi:hypothetical protein